MGHLAEIYNNLDEIKSKSRREKLGAGRENAWLSRDLITLADDAPIPDESDLFPIGEPDFEAAAPLFLDQGMRSLLSDVGLDPTRFEEPASNGNVSSGVPRPATPGGGRNDGVGNDGGTQAAPITGEMKPGCSTE